MKINTNKNIEQNLVTSTVDELLAVLECIVANDENACDEELDDRSNLLYEVECNEAYSQDGFSYSIEQSDGNEDCKVMLIMVNNNYNNTSGYISCVANVDSCGETTWETWEKSLGEFDIVV